MSIRKKGKLTKATTSAKYNGGDGAEHLGSFSSYSDYENCTWIEYDSLGRIKSYTSITSCHIDGILHESNNKVTYTYHENGFTEFCSGEDFEDGRKTHDEECSIDCEIIDIFGTYIEGERYNESYNDY